MFNKQELQLISQTLIQKRDWLSKNIGNPELVGNKAQLEKNLQVIEGIIQKINSQGSVTTENGESQTVSHYISAPSTSPIRQAAIGRRQQLAAGQIRVLVVDDDQLICDLVSVYLRAADINLIHYANDGLKGISMMYDANPVYDLVLCDWNMPTKSGIDVHNAMRAAERYMGTVFMLVTAVSDAKQIRSAIEDGVDDYVVKPIEQEKLIKKIARFFPQIGKTS